MPKPTRALRLLHLIGESRWGGREMQALALVEGLSAKGHAVVIAAPPGSRAHETARRRGLMVADLPEGGPSRWRRLRSLQRGATWDALHAHDGGALVSVVRSAIGLTARPPYLLRVRGDVRYGDRVLPKRLPLRRVARFWAVSEWVWSALVRGGIAEDRIVVLHTGIDPERFNPEARGESTSGRARAALGLTPGDFVIGTVLRLGGEKGVEDLIEAVRRIRSGECPPGEPRAKLVVVGDGPHRPSLERAASRLGPAGDEAGAVLFTGWRDDVPAVMAAFDVHVHPPVSGNGFPAALLEAMAMGLPVVATDLMGIREIIDNGRHGLIAPGADPEALARNILRYRRDPEFARQAGKSAHLKVQRYGVRAMVDRAEELYFRLVR